MKASCAVIVGGFCLILGAAAAHADGLGAIGPFQGNPAGPAFQGNPAGPPAGKPTAPPIQQPGRAPGVGDPRHHRPHPGYWPPVVVLVAPSAPPATGAWGQQLQAVQQALAGPIGQSYSWVDGTGSGSVTAVSDRFLNGLGCRDLDQTIQTSDTPQEGTSTYCLGADGWFLAGGS